MPYEALKELFGDRLLLKEPMSLHTTFKIGGPADVMLLPSSAEEVASAVKLLESSGEPYIIMGKGSNLLVGDLGIRGAVIKLSSEFGKITVSGTNVRAQSGASLASVASICLKNSLTGFEFASGIPGTIGGGAAMNAGAYGGELKDTIKSLTVLKDGHISILENADCGFGYRTSRIMQEGMIVLEAEFGLSLGEYKKIAEKMGELSSKRNEKQPLEYPSAGSTFKRPEGYFAGKLIEDCGLKGYSIGGAEVSEKHSGFVINKGGASARDVVRLIEHIQNEVMKKFDVRLEPEIRFVGEFA